MGTKRNEDVEKKHVDELSVLGAGEVEFEMAGCGRIDHGSTARS